MVDDIKDGLDDGTLVLVTALVAQHARQERQHQSLFCGKLETQGTDGIDYNDFELVADVGHKQGDLLHQTVYGGFSTGLFSKNKP